MDYKTALDYYNKERNAYNEAISKNASPKEIVNCSGRMIASLQSLRKVSLNDGLDVYDIDRELHDLLVQHKGHLNTLNTENKRSDKYSAITEMSTGFKSLINSIKTRVYADNPQQISEANKDITKSIGTNLKNIVKAPIVITTRILKSSITATILFTPVGLGLGLLDGAWKCIDSTAKSPFEGKTAKNMSKGFTNIMTKLNSKVQRM